MKRSKCSVVILLLSLCLLSLFGCKKDIDHTDSYGGRGLGTVREVLKYANDIKNYPDCKEYATPLIEIRRMGYKGNTIDEKYYQVYVNYYVKHRYPCKGHEDSAVYDGDKFDTNQYYSTTNIALDKIQESIDSGDKQVLKTEFIYSDDKIKDYIDKVK